MWYNNKAKKALLKLGMDLIKDGLCKEGGELIYSAKYGTASKTYEDTFNLLKTICWWDEENIVKFLSKFHSKNHLITAQLIAE